MRSPLLLISAGLVIATVGALVGDALDFGGLAWIVALVVMMLAISVLDRERFYGPRPPHRR